MAKTRERNHREKARAVPDKTIAETQLAEIAVRPLRLAFLIDCHASPEQLREHISYCTAVWGGASSFFIPTDGATITEEWRAVLYTYDPDKVVFCSETQIPLVNELCDQIQPFYERQWSGSLKEDHQHGFDRLGSILMSDFLRHLYDEIRPTQSTNLYIPKYTASSSMNLCAAAQLGIVDDEVVDFYEQAMKAEIAEYQNESLETYLEKMTSADSKITPLQLTTHGLSQSVSAPGAIIGAVIVILSRKSPIYDFCIYWNMRATEGMMSKGIIFLPEEALDSEDNVQHLGDWCENHIKGTNTLTIVTAGIDAERLKVLKEQVRARLKRQMVIDIWYSGFRFGQMRMHEASNLEEVRMTGRTIALRLPKPSWLNKPSSGMEWVVDMQLSYSRHGVKYIPPRFSLLNHLLDKKPDQLQVQSYGYRIRSTQKFLSLRRVVC
jgi:hypothetical protein